MSPLRTAVYSRRKSGDEPAQVRQGLAHAAMVAVDAGDQVLDAVTEPVLGGSVAV